MQLMVDNLALWSGGRWSFRPGVDKILGVSQNKDDRSGHALCGSGW